MNLIPVATVAADALNAETTRMEIIAQNIANANTTRGPDGSPYTRRSVNFESYLERTPAGDQSPRLRVGSVDFDQTPGRLVHNPGHPDADLNGMVRMPNVNVSMEMIDLITSSRAYEANLSVISTSHKMVQKTLSMGK